MPATTHRTSTWLAIALLAALSATGFRSAVEQVSTAATLGQQLATVAQFGYAIAGIVAAAALFMRLGWTRTALWVWAGLLTLTGGTAPVVWGGAGALAGISALLVTGLIAWFVIWLATRRRAI